MTARRADLLCLALLSALAAVIFLPGLGHPTFWNWDEAVHAAVARGVAETFWTPHVLAHPLRPPHADDWVNAGVFLHKPPLPFWLSALLLKLFGVSPLGLRLVSFGGLLLCALALFLFARETLGRPVALLACAAFLLLPFNWRLVQGWQFGDLTDCTLLGFQTLAFLLLLETARRDSKRLALACGAAVGAAFLCKSALALTPLGVALVLAVAGELRWARLGQIIALFLLVALPWQIACAVRFPEVSRVEWLHTLGHLSGQTVENWVRPWDALFNQNHDESLAPLPNALPLAGGVWLAWRALRRRERAVVIAALWLWSEWAVLSIGRAKVPAVAWGAVPALFFALGLALRDAFGAPLLAGGLLGTLAAPLLAPHAPWLGRLRLALPHFFFQTRERPGLFEGLAVAAVGGAAAEFFHFCEQRSHRRRGCEQRSHERPPRVARTIPAASAVALVAWLAFVRAPGMTGEARAEVETHTLSEHAREAGRAIDAQTPGRSVVFVALDRDPERQFAAQEMMFWSGRTAYRERPDVDSAHRAGLHPYLASPRDEPFREVPGVPAASWLRVYDLEQPEPLHAPPADLQPLDAQIGAMHLFGYAHDGRRWLFYARGVAERASITFDGKERVPLIPESRAGSSWFTIPLVGPAQAARVGAGR